MTSAKEANLNQDSHKPERLFWSQNLPQGGPVRGWVSKHCISKQWYACTQKWKKKISNIYDRRFEESHAQSKLIVIQVRSVLGQQIFRKNEIL
jgi:hypothetical protein